MLIGKWKQADADKEERLIAAEAEVRGNQIRKTRISVRSTEEAISWPGGLISDQF